MSAMVSYFCSLGAYVGKGEADYVAIVEVLNIVILVWVSFVSSFKYFYSYGIVWGCRPSTKVSTNYILSPL